MIRHSSAGVKLRGHPPGAVNNGTGRVDVSQIAGQLDVHSERLPTPQPQSGPPAAVDLAASVSHGQLNPPPAKRPRLDVPSALFTEDAIPVSVGSGDLKNTPGSTDSRLPFAPLRSRPAWSFKEFVSDIPTAETPAENTMALGRNGASDPPPPLPGFPWKYTPAESLGNSSARSREGSPSNDVQTTPYRIQVPDVAPVLKGNSKSCSIISGRMHLNWGIRRNG